MPERQIQPAPRPLLIEVGGHACVAWWHAASARPVAGALPSLPRDGVTASPLPLAVVLASSWGEEDLSGYDGQRELAVRLADAGLGTLRFEWPDTGDSSAETGATPPADALAAFDAAADAARALSGCRRLAFVGLRLGALMAAQAAAARDDVDALVALLPVASGRAFVREQRMLGAALARHAPGASADDPAAPVAGDGKGDGDSDVFAMLGGFALPAARADEMAALEWPSANAGGVRDALLLSSADGLARPVADALSRLGVRVEPWVHADLAAALAIAHHAGLADVAVAEIVRWLQARAHDPTAGRGGAPAAPDEHAPGDATHRQDARATPCVRPPGAVLPAAPPAWMRLDVDGTRIRERICLIDAAGASTLAGVLSEPDPDAGPIAPDAIPPATSGPRRGILLLSSGRERRIGPHRLWVPFARRRAARGDVVLRLDIPGIGDSEPRERPDPDGVPALYDPRCVADVARALAWLRVEHGVGPCTVMGVCSGAHHAWRVALEGVDVQRVVSINPLVFHWKPGMSLDPQAHAFGQIAIAANAGRSLLDPARWWKLLSGRANVGVITGAIAARLRHALRLRVRELARRLRWPLSDDLAAELARTGARGVAIGFVFSAREPGLTLLREESGRAGVRLQRDTLFKVCEVAHADHTFAGTRGRARLYAVLDSLLLSPHPHGS